MEEIGTQSSDYVRRDVSNDSSISGDSNQGVIHTGPKAGTKRKYFTTEEDKVILEVFGYLFFVITLDFALFA